MNIDEFEGLPEDRQEQIFHKSSFKDKAELILHSHNPAGLTKSLSQEELYLLTREMDIEERAEVIRYATLPQLFFISDVDCWKKDRLDRKSFLQWIETLLAADEKKLLAWLLEMDYETIVAGFAKLMQVLKPDHEWTADEALGDTPYFSLDQMYYISAEEDNLETLRRTLEILFLNHRGRYVALLEGVMSELEDQLEEDAYSRRDSRLAERGFPDFETAQKIYRPLTREEYEKFPLKSAVRLHDTHDKEMVVPNYLMLWSEERFFLDDILHSFQDDPKTQDSLQEELAWISNKVIACEGIDFSSEEKVRRGIEQARGMINIGLELLSGGDFQKARAVLQERWLELVFRWGATRVTELKEHARRIVRDYWSSSQTDFLNFLDAPYDTLFNGLLRLSPLCYDPSLNQEDSLRHFKTAVDTDRSKNALIQIEKIHEVLRGNLSKEYAKARKESLESEPVLSLFSFLGTLFSNWILSGKVSYLAVPVSALSGLLDQGFESRGEVRVLVASSKTGFLSAFLTPETQEICRAFFALFFERFEEEFSRIKSGEKIQPEFISMIRLSAEEKPKAAKKRILKRKKTGH